MKDARWKHSLYVEGKKKKKKTFHPLAKLMFEASTSELFYIVIFFKEISVYMPYFWN